jgi:iron complex transport system ATP-binding protein
VTAALSLGGLCVRQGSRDILADVSLEVAPGEVLGLVGPNGAGKTTLLRAALGLRARSGGEARLFGRPIEALSLPARAACIGYLPQERRVAWNMPALEVAALGAARLAPGDSRAVAQSCLVELEVGELAWRGVLDMSGGERARVLLARLLATQAKLLVADEPAAGLDPEAQFLIMERLADRARAGAAVVVTLHDLTLAARTCDRLAVLSHGRLTALGSPDQALGRDILREVFGLDGELAPTAAGPVIAARRAPVSGR